MQETVDDCQSLLAGSDEKVSVYWVAERFDTSQDAADRQRRQRKTSIVERSESGSTTASSAATAPWEKLR